MNAVALLGIKAELGKLRHKGALTTEKFQLLKARMKDGSHRTVVGLAQPSMGTALRWYARRERVRGHQDSGQ